jgi:hypothetical protein
MFASAHCKLAGACHNFGLYWLVGNAAAASAHQRSTCPLLLTTYEAALDQNPLYTHMLRARQLLLHPGMLLQCSTALAVLPAITCCLLNLPGLAGPLL